MKFLAQLLPILSFSVAMADEPLPLSKSYWQEASFQKSFNGSYRIQARIEPNVSTEERGLLVEMQDLMAKGQRSNALKKIEASPLLKKSPALQFNLGNLHFENGDTDEAIKAFKEALADFPSFRRAHRNLAFALVRKDDLAGALPHLIEAMQLGDQDSATYGLLGYCRLQREEWASALQAYRMAQLSEPDTIEWKAGTAQCLQHLNASHEAVILLDEVINARPAEASYAVLQASILLDLDRSEDAVKALELPRRLGTLDAASFMLLADLHLRAHRPADATTIIAEAYALEKKPSLDRALSLAATGLHLKDYHFTRSLLTIAQPQEDASPVGLRRITAILDIQSGEAPEEEAKTLATLLQESPIDGPTLLALGHYEADTDNNDRASIHFERATAVEASAADAWLALTNLQVRTGRYHQAIVSLKKSLALKTDSNLEAYLINLEQIQEAAR